jgi:hypothetical protein
MANTLGNVNNGRLIAQKALTTLLARFPVLNNVAHNFSDKALKYGETLNARVVTATTAGAFDPAVGYVATDRAQVDIPVVLNNHIHHTYGITDQERSSSQIDLIQNFADTAAYSIGSKIMQTLFGLALNANFANKITKAVGSFDRTVVVDLAVDLNSRFVPDMNRSLVLSSLYFGALEKDITIVGNLYNKDGDIGANRLPNVHGFDVTEFAQLPSNSENLVGLAISPEALGIVTSIPEMPGVREGGLMSVVTDDRTGLSVLLRQWYDWTKGVENRTLTLMFGVAKGVTDNATRLVSA